MVELSFNVNDNKSINLGELKDIKYNRPRLSLEGIELSWVHHGLRNSKVTEQVMLNLTTVLRGFVNPNGKDNFQ